MNYDIREKKKTLIEKNKKTKKKETKKKANSASQHVKTDFRSAMSEERLNSFMTDVLIIKRSVH